MATSIVKCHAGAGDGMPRHFVSKSDYRRYVKKWQDRARLYKIGSPKTPWGLKFQPRIDTEKDFFNNKYQNVVKGYQNLAAMEKFRHRSQEEWRWLHYQGARLEKNCKNICEDFRKASISSDITKRETSPKNPFLKLFSNLRVTSIWDTSYQDKRDERTNLVEVAEPFGHNSLYSHLEPVSGEVNLQLFDFPALKFSDNGHVNSFLDYIIKGVG
ncbi:hypothetical protein BDFB_003654 [Asbolus verrucosus]|uniref:Uncharacterized protein n=1 Tax=Asbolus verrucosus TaxID=1661398 RepID=A0A482W9A9_ASBVE|nr:hypothetical protein BDFB_003654 [Asbolus verrucosus]